jgi:flagellar motor switch protein FliM
VLQTEKSVNTDMLVCVEGVPKFRGKPGTIKGHKAVQLTRHCSPRERIN